MTARDDGAVGGAGKKGSAMTTTTTGPGAGATARPRRRVVILGAVGLVVVVALVVVLVLTSGGSSASGGAAAAATTTSASAPDTSVVPMPPTPTPTGPTAEATDLPSALPEVALDSPAAVGNGVVAMLPAIEGIQGTADGPGNVAGPAVRVTVRIQNGTAGAVALSGVAVNMYYGADRTPASPLDDPSQRPFSGSVAAGASAEGVYVFSVPEDARGQVAVEVGYQAGAPLLLFTGAVR
jgi:hypothetical protein